MELDASIAYTAEANRCAENTNVITTKFVLAAVDHRMFNTARHVLSLLGL